MIPRFLVLSGDGLNCEYETSRAVKKVGANVEIINITDFCEKSKNVDFLFDHQGIIVPGGFSFGDHLGSGRILAEKLKGEVLNNIMRFCERGGFLLGICNGFQVLCQLGLFDTQVRYKNKLYNVSPRLVENSPAGFVDRWVNLNVSHKSSSKSHVLKSLETGAILVRHAEGRLVFAGSLIDAFGNNVDQMNNFILDEYDNKGMIGLTYESSFNGSVGRIAGLCHSQLRIFGLMPHPESSFENLTQQNVVSKNIKNLNFSHLFWDNLVKLYM